MRSEEREAIKHAVAVARRRLEELDGKPRLTRAEFFEREMTLDCIQRGEKMLGERVPAWKPRPDSAGKG